MLTPKEDTITKLSVENVIGCKKLQYITLKKVKYQTDSDNIAIAQNQAYAKQQEDMNLARGAAQLKYEGLYKTTTRKVVKASKPYSIWSHWRSVDRLKLWNMQIMGHEVNAIGRK